MVYQLIAQNKENFDLIIAPGNSGIMMGKITEMTYEYLGIKSPPILKMPIYLRDRTGKRIKFDNSVLIPQIKKQLKNVKNLNKILFVDDEINQNDPKTARVVLNLIKGSVSEKLANKVSVFIVAEGRWKGILRNIDISGFKIKFMPFEIADKKEWKGIFNFVSYEIPWKIQEQIRKYYSDKIIGSKEMFCILFGEPIKLFNNGKPTLSHKWEPILKRKVGNFSKLQGSFKIHIKTLIKETIEEQK